MSAMSRTSSLNGTSLFRRASAVAATILTGVAAGSASTVMPVAFAASRAYSMSQTSVLGSLEMVGTTLALLLAGAFIARLPRRPLILAGGSLVLPKRRVLYAAHKEVVQPYVRLYSD